MSHASWLNRKVLLDAAMTSMYQQCMLIIMPPHPADLVTMPGAPGCFVHNVHADVIQRVMVVGEPMSIAATMAWKRVREPEVRVTSNPTRTEEILMS